MIDWVRHRKFAIFFTVFIAGVAFFIYTSNSNNVKDSEERVVNAQVISCQRVNDLRRKHNRLARSTRTFMESAATARRRSGDKDIAAIYQHLADSFRLVIIPDCGKVVREDLERGRAIPPERRAR